MSTAFRHNLGDRVKDRISGLTGIVTSRSEHLFGCARYWVEPQELKDGKRVDGCWLDEDAIEVVEAAVIEPQQYRVVAAAREPAARLQRAGGPTDQPSSQARASEL